MEYIRSAKDDEREGCVFCEIQADPHESKRVLARSALAYVVLNLYPYNPGHLLIVPTRHVGDPEDVTLEEAVEMHELLQRSLRALREEAEPNGFNIGMNLGRIAGAGIPDHLHWHVVPRWTGDTNYISTVGETRVLPELLEETRRRLASKFER